MLLVVCFPYTYAESNRNRIACVMLVPDQERIRIENLQNRIGSGLKKSESAHLTRQSIGNTFSAKRSSVFVKLLTLHIGMLRVPKSWRKVRFLAYLVIFCFEKRRPKQKYCCWPKVKRFDSPKILDWLHHWLFIPKVTKLQDQIRPAKSVYGIRIPDYHCTAPQMS